MPTSQGIDLPLSLGIPQALDTRYRVANLAALTSAGIQAVAYLGMQVYVESVNRIYCCIDPENAGTAPGDAGSGWVYLAVVANAVTQVNNNNPVDNNVTITLLATRAGLSASLARNVGTLGPNWDLLPQLSSSFPFYKLADGSTPAAAPGTGSVWVVTGETITARTGSNGKVFIFTSSSQFTGRWIETQAFSNTVVTSYLNNYFNENSVPLSDSASAILTQDASGIESGQFPLMLWPGDYPAGNYGTPYISASLAYDFDTNVLNVVSTSSLSITLPDNTVIDGTTIVWVGDDGQLNVGSSETPTPVTTAIDYYTNNLTTTDTTTDTLSSLQIINYDTNVTVNFDSGTGKLTIYFGTPSSVQISSLSATNWTTNRFNNTAAGFTLAGQWNNGSATFLSASLFISSSTGWVKLTERTQGSNPNSTTISVTPDSAANTPYVRMGQSYAGSAIAALFNNNYPVGKNIFKLDVTGSLPDGTLSKATTTHTQTLNVSLPAIPTLGFTYTSDSGITSWNTANHGSQGTAPYIEYGDTGVLTYNATDNNTTIFVPKDVNGQGASEHFQYFPETDQSVTISSTTSGTKFHVTASYFSDTLNQPDPTIPRYSAVSTLTRKISVRFGRYEVASSNDSAPSLTNNQLTDVANWATNIYDGQSGTGTKLMDQGRVYWDKPDNPASWGQSATYKVSLDVPVNTINYFFIVINAAYSISYLANTQYPNTNLIGSAWELVGTVGAFKVYRTSQPYSATGTGTTAYEYYIDQA
jgi:hypothetical protein